MQATSDNADFVNLPTTIPSGTFAPALSGNHIGTTMRLNVSQIKCFQRSPMEWYYRYHLRRVPRRADSSYFLTGRWWHELMERFFLTSDPLVAAEYGMEMLDKICEEMAPLPNSAIEIEKFRDEALRLLSLFHVMPGKFIPTSTIAVEQAIETHLPGTNHTLIGRPDRIIQMHDKFWHLQFKTISDRTSIPVFVQTRERDLHELVYAYLITGKYCTPDQFGGCYLHAIRKLSRKAINERPHEAFVQELIPISWSQVTDAICDIMDLADEMSDMSEGISRLIQNRDSDTNRFGNVLSPYYDIYSGRVSISDDRLFMDTPADPYETEGNE